MVQGTHEDLDDRYSGREAGSGIQGWQAIHFPWGEGGEATTGRGQLKPFGEQGAKDGAYGAYFNLTRTFTLATHPDQPYW